MSKKKYILLGLLIVVLAFGANAIFNNHTKNDGPLITIYKSPTCGCCVGWAAYLKDEGYNVKTVVLDDLSSIKAKHKIPKGLESCHTAEVGGYFVEGHIPVEVINSMLEDKPNIDGIALPRMPSGSPGMPGPKDGPWTIYSLTDGVQSEYLII